MKRIFQPFKHGVIQLTFRLLPNAGGAPWAMGGLPGKPNGEPMENPILQKFKKKQEWFDYKNDEMDALLGLVDDEIEDEELNGDDTETDDMDDQEIFDILDLD